MRFRTAAVVLALAALTSACGDPLVVQGDAPGYMRVVIGEAGVAGERVDSLASRTLLTDPSAVAFDEDAGRLFVFDRGTHVFLLGIRVRAARIFEVDSRGRARLAVNSGGCTAGVCLHSVAQAVWAADGTLLLADPFGNRIMRYDPAARRLTVVAGTGVDAFSPDGAAAAQSPVRRPQGIAIAPGGIIYFSEEAAVRLRYIDAQGRLQTLAGTGVAGYSGDGAAATAARLNGPSNLALRGSTLYFADANNHVVRAIDLASGVIATMAGTATPGFAGDGGAALQARLFSPYGLALSPDENQLYISDRQNHRVRSIFLPTGVIETVAGTGSSQANGSRGPAGAVSLSGPTGLATTERGFLYVADTGHSAVWRSTLSFQD